MHAAVIKRMILSGRRGETGRRDDGGMRNEDEASGRLTCMSLEGLLTALHSGGGAKELLYFIASGGHVDDPLSHHPRETTLLHAAIEHANLAMIEALLTEGANAEIRDPSGHTALQHALEVELDLAGQMSWAEGDYQRNLRFAMCGLLAAYGADTSATTPDGMTLLQMAAPYGPEAVHKLRSALGLS